MGIKDLDIETAYQRGGMRIEDLLEGLTPKLRDKLTEALVARRLDGKNAFSPAVIAQACADDGFIVTRHSIRMWRERNNVDR